MTIAVYGKSLAQGQLKVVLESIHNLIRDGIKIKLHQGIASQFGNDIPKEVLFFKDYIDLIPETDFLISIGGDGTFLEAVSMIRNSGIPILGVNAGRLGFLSNTALNEFEHAIHCLISNKFNLEERTLLKLEGEDFSFDGYPYALNEISLLKRDSSSMITVDVKVDGIHLNTYWTDGLIVATATGSTAYSLSGGGPILFPGSGNFVITPIAPHNLNVRPIVISDGSILEVQVKGRTDSHLIALDSKSEKIKNNSCFKIQKATHTVSLVQLENDSFIQSLRNKLNWGFDKRNE